MPIITKRIQKLGRGVITVPNGVSTLSSGETLCTLLSFVYIDDLRFANYKVYVLSLEDGHYYVGVTLDVDRRFKEHSMGAGSLWASKYKPVKIIEVYDLGITTQFQALRHEDMVTLRYIDRYGLEFVRGGMVLAHRPSTAAKCLETVRRKYTT